VPQDGSAAVTLCGQRYLKAACHEMLAAFRYKIPFSKVVIFNIGKWLFLFERFETAPDSDNFVRGAALFCVVGTTLI
jgi:hypothetical protein